MPTVPHLRPPPRVARALPVLALLAAAIVAPAQPPGGGGPPPARVVTDPARTQTIERWREVTGELRAPVRSTLAGQQAGLVIQLNVEPGDRIEAGKVIAKLDDRTPRLEVTQGESTVSTRRATVSERQALADKARRDLERYDAAFKASGATQSELDDARTAVAEADARLAQAQAELAWGESSLALARKRFEDMTIRAPFTGVVAVKRTEPGEWLAEGGPVIDLIALDAIDAWLDVPEAFIDRLRSEDSAGDSAPVNVQLRVPAIRAGAAGEPALTAPIAGIIPTADPLSRLFPVRVRIDNRDNRLKPGMSVVGLIPSGQAEPTLTISKDALLRNESGTHVYYDNNGAAAIAPVTVLHAFGDRLAITSPTLKDGADVVVEGNERLFPGQPLNKQSRPPTP